MLEAEGRAPVHNRAGSNMTWGIATALLEQEGSEGLFEVDEAWLPKVAAQLDPTLIVLGNLFRDQLDRYGEIEVLADGWAKTVAERVGRTRFVLNADDPLIADLGRDTDERPSRGRRLLRDRGPLAGAARAPACLRRQALPPLRPPLLLRAGVRRPPRALLVPQLRRRAAGARRRGDGDRAARDGGLDRHRPHAGRRVRPRALDAGPLQRLQRARGGRGRPRAGRRPRSGSRRRWPAPGRPSAGSRRSRSTASGPRSCWSRTRPGPTRC